MSELGSGQRFNREPAAAGFDLITVRISLDGMMSSRRARPKTVRSIRVQRDSEFEERCAEQSLKQAGLVPLQTQTRRETRLPAGGRRPLGGEGDPIARWKPADLCKQGVTITSLRRMAGCWTSDIDFGAPTLIGTR